VFVTHWLKGYFFDSGKESVRTHHSTYLDNEFIDDEYIGVLGALKEADPYYHTVYALGQWGVVGKTLYNSQIVTERLTKVLNVRGIRGDFIYRYEYDRIVDKSIRFVANEAGMVTLYELPKPDYPYCIGADTAESGEDYCAASVRENISMGQVAVFHGQLDIDLFAKQLYCLGKHYNEALIGVETNFDTHPVKELQRLGYYRQYMREKFDQITKTLQRKWGFKTTKITRPAIISKHIALAREQIDTFNSAVQLEEMLTFVRNKEGRPEAKEGMHDDLLMADAICCEIRAQQTEKLPMEVKVKSFIAEHKDRIAKGNRVRRLV